MKMLAYLDRHRDWVALVVALVVSVALMSASGHPNADTFRRTVSRPFELFAAPFNFVTRAVSLWDENADLRAKLVELSAERSQWRDALLENARLRRLLGFRDRPEFDYLAAEVIAREPTPALSSLVLDKGSGQGIDVGQAVVTADGLAGVVHRAGPASCTVLLATDRNFAVSARVERTRVDGIVRWAGGGKMALTEVPRNLDVKPGDRVVTSGLGGVIPGGIPIGLVESVNREDQLFLEVIVEPFVRYHKLEELFVLLPRARAGDSAAGSSERGEPRG